MKIKKITAFRVIFYELIEYPFWPNKNVRKFDTKFIKLYT